jgi:hypothetical protein
MLRLARERRERPRIAARWTHNRPRVLGRQAHRSQQQSKSKKRLGRSPDPAPMTSNTPQAAHSDLKLPIISFKTRIYLFPE